jgi:hypothetical protein
LGALAAEYELAGSIVAAATFIGRALVIVAEVNQQASERDDA